MTLSRCRIIGLTGQSGSGKSTVAKCFENHGLRVINADLLVRRIYESNSPCLKTISAVFGVDVINPDGTPDRKLLAQRAFSTPENTEMLGEIVHPFVTAEFFKEVKKAVNEGLNIVVYDAPQLFESNAQVICDTVISVLADRKIRINRICSRDNITEEQAEMRVNAQLSENFFRENSDFIIENNGSVEMLAQQAERLINITR